ncbi:MAG: hypothetical protein PHC62_10595, partial [Candidatus Izemoplasmatales bacterium]|nr:hypothetical protein [Candidatus Izemoplasmatales bacterium]
GGNCMQGKQLYASLEISEDEIRLLVGEYYMSRFNILRSDCMKLNQAINNKKIERPQVVNATITKLLNNAEKALSLKIKKVILCIPSADVKCVRKRVNVAVEEGSRKILMSHVRSGLEKAINYDDIGIHEFVNIGSIKYIVGGISSRTIPLDEKTDLLTMDVDMLYADKDIVYSYVMCVESCGVSVLDICLDGFAMAEETASLENSMDKYVILADLQKNDTILSLYYKGRLLECENIGKGYQSWINELHRRHRLSAVEAEAMLLENCFEEKAIYDDIVSYIWMDRNEQKQLTKKEIYDTVSEQVESWQNAINEMCEPIKEHGNSKLIMSGKGADIVGINSVLKGLILPTQIYIPSSVGVREGKYAVCLGAMYCTKKWQEIKNIKEVSIEYNNLIAREVKREDETGFTKKLKNILQVK